MKFYSIPSPRVRRTDWKRIVLVGMLALSTAMSLSSPFRRQSRLASNYHVPAAHRQTQSATQTKTFTVGENAAVTKVNQAAPALAATVKRASNP